MYRNVDWIFMLLFGWWSQTCKKPHYLGGCGISNQHESACSEHATHPLWREVDFKNCTDSLESAPQLPNPGCLPYKCYFSYNIARVNERPKSNNSIWLSSLRFPNTIIIAPPKLPAGAIKSLLITACRRRSNRILPNFGMSRDTI